MVNINTPVHGDVKVEVGVQAAQVLGDHIRRAVEVLAEAHREQASAMRALAEARMAEATKEAGWAAWIQTAIVVGTVLAGLVGLVALLGAACFWADRAVAAEERGRGGGRGGT